ncbi:unnamed protein product [Wuchereria bancrofti]|uniref:Transmembrane protein n=1 Tax=Wuchereria bancrofti TaxID=6293 RepID=A0A3P7DWX6_WUCBA|nr:unnamed protein product [Wuchereria bancrofti]
MEPQDLQDQKDLQVQMDHQVSMDNQDLPDQLDLQEHQEKKAFVLNIALLMVVFFLKMVPGDNLEKWWYITTFSPIYFLLTSFKICFFFL